MVQKIESCDVDERMKENELEQKMEELDKENNVRRTKNYLVERR